jgi:colanic acid biosynthesis glycosyl transferase WcaI
MASQLAQRLSSDGHAVNMVVPFPNRPYGRVYDGFRRRLSQVETAGEGYRLVRCANWLIGSRRRHINRLLENITFGMSSAWSAWRAGRPDVMIVETWPIFAMLFPLLLAKWWGLPLLYYVQDVYPEAAERIGLISSTGLMPHLCRALDAWICLCSTKTLVISEATRDLLAATRRVPPERFTVIPNWVDAAAFVPKPIDNSWRREQGIPSETFVAIFGGTLGNVSGVEILVEVAEQLRHRRDVLIICVGEGIRKQQMVDRSRLLGLENIRFLPFQPRDRVPEVQGAANATLLTMQPNASDASVPSKLVSYMAAGRPVICAAPPTTAVAQIVVESAAGVVTESGDAAALAQAIEYLASRPAEAERMGRNARAYFERHMTLDRAYAQFSALLHEVVRQGPVATAARTAAA